MTLVEEEWERKHHKLIMGARGQTKSSKTEENIAHSHSQKYGADRWVQEAEVSRYPEGWRDCESLILKVLGFRRNAVT